MNNLFKNIQEKLLLLVKGSLWGILVSVAPLALIHHRQVGLFFHQLDWSLEGFFVLCLFAGITFSFSMPAFSSNKLILTSALFYLFCYTACCALCQKLGWTLIFSAQNAQISSSSFVVFLPIMIVGWFLISLSAAIQLAGAAKKAQNLESAKKDKHETPPSLALTTYKDSFLLSCLLLLAGISLSFGVWLPLIAIPGVWVAIKWFD